MTIVCELCDELVPDPIAYFVHLQNEHDMFPDSFLEDMNKITKYLCGLCRSKFWSGEGLERHHLMDHGYATGRFLIQFQANRDGGICKFCGVHMTEGMLNHLCDAHQVEVQYNELIFGCHHCDYSSGAYFNLLMHFDVTHLGLPVHEVMKAAAKIQKQLNKRNNNNNNNEGSDGASATSAA